jgi:mRNA interferase MazF
VIKDFASWNNRKIDINDNGTNKYYHPRDIWWCSLGLNIGFEQDGKDQEFQRPVLILKGISDKTCLIIPLTTSLHVHKYRYPLGEVTGKKSTAILSQMRVIDTKRLINKIGVLDKEKFTNIKKAIRTFI